MRPVRRGVSRQSTAFGTVAADYDRYRPDPSPQVLDWLLRLGPADVVDVGAGTGQLTQLLVDRGVTVTAVEPDARMRRALHARVPSARVVAGVAERLPVPDASQDAVLAHAAWHWFDPRDAVAEAARVLRPGGRLGVLGTRFDPDVEWLEELWERLEPDPGARRPGGRPNWQRLPWQRLPGAPVARLRRARSFGLPWAPFERQEDHVVRFSRTFVPADLLGLMGTYSGMIVKAPAERDALLEQVRELIEGHPALAGRDAFEVPMLTHAWRADRRRVRSRRARA